MRWPTEVQLILNSTDDTSNKLLCICSRGKRREPSFMLEHTCVEYVCVCACVRVCVCVFAFSYAINMHTRTNLHTHTHTHTHAVIIIIFFILAMSYQWNRIMRPMACLMLFVSTLPLSSIDLSQKVLSYISYWILRKC